MTTRRKRKPGFLEEHSLSIVAEWLQMAGLVFLTKKLRESGSKE